MTRILKHTRKFIINQNATIGEIIEIFERRATAIYDLDHDLINFNQENLYPYSTTLGNIPIQDRRRLTNALKYLFKRGVLDEEDIEKGFCLL